MKTHSNGFFIFLFLFLFFLVPSSISQLPLTNDPNQQNPSANSPIFHNNDPNQHNPSSNSSISHNNDPDQQNPSPNSSIFHNKKIQAAVLTVVAIAGAGFGLGIAILVVLIHRRLYPSVIRSGLINTNTPNSPTIDFIKAMEAVADPANTMFKTRFSTYYKATMACGTRYSVKALEQSNQIYQLVGYERFKHELDVLGNLYHSNIMPPLAYLLTPSHAYLFYEYTHKGTVFGFLHSRAGSMLDWESRYSIGVGVARGLAFLHGCIDPIVHLDLSTRSIVLKSQNEPQIADIELCKLIDTSMRSVSLSVVAGEVGYIPPEYPYTMRVTVPGNVYSFGVILLELLTGKPPVSEGIELAKWVLSTPSRHEPWEQILDPTLSNSSLEVCNEMLSVLKVALDCVSLSPEARPDMATVVTMLLRDEAS